MATAEGDHLTDAQNELYSWIKNYMRDFQHSPSIRQMMQAMGLKSPAPIQSRLKHLQEKGYISWQEGKARTMQIVDEINDGVPIMGAVAAGGLIETYSDVNENLLKITNDPITAVQGANVLYTDVWSSMGEENKKEEKDKDFLGFTVDQNLVRNADKDAIILHCLPAYRAKEINDEVFESEKSRIFDQAENRLHAQQALLSCLLS